MKRALRLACALPLWLTIAAPLTWAADTTDPIADYQADLSAGAVSAGEILGLTGSAISTIQTPKDFIAALNAINSGAGKTGFGLSFTPGRTRVAPVSIAAYRDSLGARAWAGTAFSYAQNTNTLGSVDHRQEAYALRVAFYLKADDDPAVAGHIGFQDCVALIDLADARTRRMLEILKGLSKKNPGLAPDARNEEAKKILAAEEPFALKAEPAYKSCVNTAIAQAKAKWNASQVALTLGEGTIRNPAADSSRLSLGRFGSLALAVGPNPDTLVNVTVRRTGRALELSTINDASPIYDTHTLVGARLTYRAIETQNLYALAEVSNVKASTTTTSNVFKYALGIDKRLAEGMWIELRVGRNRTQDGQSEQTTALMSLKLSPQSSLAP